MIEKSRNADPPKKDRIATVTIVVTDVSKVRESVALMA